jgi:hypothetical protein
MCSRGVVIHYFSRLSATTAVLAAEVPRGDGVSTQWAPERTKAAHHFDGVMSHSFKCSRLSRYDSELKLPSHLFICNQTHSQPFLNKRTMKGLYESKEAIPTTSDSSCCSR